ncbi:hypothetical protein WJX84_008866 [Apatococcus fuscideae]|uniref:Uncharacterized protein n=1 Tax=Apatococcus fuscideae TaxID=2026836 RepID=A0AAW1TCA3_9CHLO
MGGRGAYPRRIKMSMSQPVLGQGVAQAGGVLFILAGCSRAVDGCGTPCCFQPSQLHPSKQWPRRPSGHMYGCKAARKLRHGPRGCQWLPSSDCAREAAWSWFGHVWCCNCHGRTRHFPRVRRSTDLCHQRHLAGTAWARSKLGAPSGLSPGQDGHRTGWRLQLHPGMCVQLGAQQAAISDLSGGFLLGLSGSPAGIQICKLLANDHLRQTLACLASLAKRVISTHIEDHNNRRRLTQDNATGVEATRQHLRAGEKHYRVIAIWQHFANSMDALWTLLVDYKVHPAILCSD